MSILTIQNEQVAIKINTNGAVLESVFSKRYDKELLWQGDEKSWSKKDVCIFPFVGRLKDGYYTVNGNRYQLPIHGFVGENELKVVSATAEALTLELGYSDRTLEMYPYKFRFLVAFSLDGAKVKVEYTVENLDDKIIYYGIGGHPGFALNCVEGDNSTSIDGNVLAFDADTYLTRITLDDSNRYIGGEEFYSNTRKVMVSKELFANDALIFKNNFDNVTLRRKDGIYINFSSNAEFISFWTHAKCGGYLCLEPWWSLPDFENTIRELSDKPTIKKCKVGAVKNYSYAFEIK